MIAQRRMDRLHQCNRPKTNDLMELAVEILQNEGFYSSLLNKKSFSHQILPRS